MLELNVVYAVPKREYLLLPSKDIYLDRPITVSRAAAYKILHMHTWNIMDQFCYHLAMVFSSYQLVM
jgi:hypothetical protein